MNKIPRVYAGLAVLLMIPIVWFGRYALLGAKQEGRPWQMAVAAARIQFGPTARVLERTPDGLPRLLLAATKRDGNWPLRQQLESEGLTFVDQLGSSLHFKDVEGRSVRYTVRMFTRSMMVGELAQP